jgi:hypothetical protein
MIAGIASILVCEYGYTFKGAYVCIELLLPPDMPEGFEMPYGTEVTIQEAFARFPGEDLEFVIHGVVSALTQSGAESSHVFAKVRELYISS